MTQSQVPARARGGGDRSGWTIFRVRGVPVRVDLSWLIIAGLVIWVLTQQLADVVGDQGSAVVIASAVAVTIGFFASILAHELGHTLASLARGVRVLGIKLFMLGGVTESASEAKSARDEFVIVGIGPFVSLVLAATFGLIYAAVQDIQPFAAIAGGLAWLNLALAVFNVIPGYPLDGGRLLRSLLWGATGKPHQATRWAARVGQAFALLLLACALYGLLNAPIPFGGFLGRVAAVIAGSPIWNGLIGIFLLRGASEAHQRARLRERLEGRRVRDVMGSVPPSLDANATLEAVVERLQARPSLLWPVGDPLSGAVRLADFEAVARDAWAYTPLSQVAHDRETVTVEADATIESALVRLGSAPGNMLIVTETGRPVGLITPSLLAGVSH